MKKINMIIVCALIHFSMVIGKINAQTTLVAGDIAFTGYNGENTPITSAGPYDSFSFVILRVGGISAGTMISFTDCGWQSTAACGFDNFVPENGSSEATIVWNSGGAALPYGAQVTINGPTATVGSLISLGNTMPANTGLTLSSLGDQIIAFQGTRASSTIIAAINANCSATSTDAGWDITAGNTGSFIPPCLSNGVNAIVLYTGATIATGVESDNEVLTCFSATGVRATDLAYCNNRSNWLFDDAIPYPLPPPICCTNPTVPTLSASPTTVCAGASSTITITGTLNSATSWRVYSASCGGTVVGNTASSTFPVSPGSNTTYFIRGEGGCVVPGSCGQVTVNANPAINITPSQANVTCNGGNNGSATASVTGGNGSYSYSWAPSGGTGATASILIAGSYTVTVTDGLGCTKTQSYTITQPAAITTSAGTVNNVSCFGGSNGSAQVIASGGTGTLTYSWAPSGGTGATASGLSSGNYTVTVTDASTCTKTQTYAITSPTQITFNPSSQTNIACFGGLTGSASVTAGGGAPGYTYSWAPSGGTGATASGLGINNYTVTITDANTCTRTTSFNITQPTAALSTSPGTVTNVACFGGNNGSAQVIASAGTPGYSYSWAPSGGTGSTASGLTANTYTVTVTDANLCTKTHTFTITQPATAISTSSGPIFHVSCNGGSNGIAQVIASGGTGTLTYSWAPSGGTGSTETGLSFGNYTVTVTDANLCTKTQTFTITQPTAIVTSVGTVNNVSCFGGSNGSAQVIASGGTGSLTYSWAPSGGTAATASGLTSGNYTVTVSDDYTCSKTQTINITAPPLLVLTSNTQTNVSCFGGSNGAASVNVATGGAGGNTYNWTPGNPAGDGTVSVTSLTAGVYTCTVTDANSCIASQTFNITAPPVLGLTPNTQTNVSCFGGSNGAASVNIATGGAGGNTYNWTPGTPTGDGTVSVTGLTAGVYTCTVTDANSCTASQTFNITAPPVLGLTTNTQTNVSCFGGANGAAAVNAATGGAGGNTYNWTPGNPTGDGTVSVTGVSAGVYTCTVTDANSCTASQTFNITSPPIISLITSSTASNCGSADGTATVVASGGTGGYGYSWNPSGATTAAVTSISGGVYTVTVTDANTCTMTATETVATSGGVSFTLSTTDVSCNGGNNGAVNLTITSGVPTITFVWSNGHVTEDISGLTANTYSVTATAGNGCTATGSVIINQPTPIAINSTLTNVDCNGNSTGNIDLNVSGGTGPSYTYSWSNGPVSEDLSLLPAGTYAVTVTDINLCTGTASYNITQPGALVATTSHTDITCNGNNNGTIDLTVTDGTIAYDFIWSNSEVTEDLTGLAPGSYSVTITDDNGCTTTASATIIEPALLALTIAGNNIDCNGNNTGSVNLDVTGGMGLHTYAWDNSDTTQDIEDLIPGCYSVTVTDDNGCTATASTCITEPTVLVVTPGTTTNNICNGASDGSASVTVSGGSPGYTYMWSPSGGNSNIATNLMAGGYTVTVTDTNSCTQTTNFNITEPPPTIILSASADPDTICAGDNADLSASGATSYNWEPGSMSDSLETVTPAVTTIYTVIGTDGSGCTASLIVTVTVNPLPIIGYVAVSNDTVCAGTSVTINGTGGISYTWTGGITDGEIFTPVSSSSYTVTGTDGNSCSSTAIAGIVVNPLPVFNLGTDIVQPNPPAILDAGPGFSEYTWSTSGNTQTISVNTNGTYWVVVTDSNSCTGSDTIQVNFTSGIFNPDGSITHISLYPNPSTDFINLHIQDLQTDDMTIEVIDSKGSMIIAFAPQSVAGTFNQVIPVQQLHSGMYVLQVKANNYISQIRFIKK